MFQEKEINQEQELPVNETEVKTEETTIDSTEATTEEAPVELTWEDKYEEMNDKFIRLYAEFDNYRRRTNKERIDLIGSASAGVVRDMIPVLDDFDRAILNNEKSDDIKAVKEGFLLVSTKFRGILDTSF